MKKLIARFNGMTKTQKILAGTAAVVLVAAGTVAAVYVAKRIKAKKVA